MFQTNTLSILTSTDKKNDYQGNFGMALFLHTTSYHKREFLPFKGLNWIIYCLCRPIWAILNENLKYTCGGDQAGKGSQVVTCLVY